MSFFTNGDASAQLVPGSVYPGEIDMTLRKGPDVTHQMRPIIISEKMQGAETPAVTIPHYYRQNNQQLQIKQVPIKHLGDNSLHSANPLLSKHLYNKVEESIPTASLLSVRDWR